MNWTPYLPPDRDVQASKNADFEACLSYSAIHILEMCLKKQTGYFWEFSERALAKLSDTQPWGNTIQNVINALNQYGVILASDWPPLTYSTDYENIDWATYYADIPVDVLRRAYRVSCNLTKLTPDQVEQALTQAPLWTIVKTSSGQQHIVAQINDTQFFDSYQVTVKNFSDGYPILNQYLLSLKLLTMPNVEFVHKSGTGEYGFFVPAMSEDALKDKALNFAVPLLKPDGTIDYSLAKDVSGL